MSSKKNNKGKLSRFIYWLTSLEVVRQIFIIYLFITLIGSLVLFLPISHSGNVNISYIDALFTAASAFSDTGLVTGSTAEMWSNFGQAVIAILILTGGIGFFALKVYIFNIIIFNRPMSLRSRESLSAERGSVRIGATRNLIKNSVTTLLILIVIFSFILTIYFYYADVDTSFITNNAGIKAKDWTTGSRNAITVKDVFYEGVPKGNFALSLRFGVFHTISAINNAGFDIIGGYSLLGYYHNVGIQLMFILLFVIGGLGFPVINDTILWMKSLFTKERFSFSLFSKLSTITYVIVALIGLSMAFGFETTASYENVRPENLTIWNLDPAIYGDKGMKSMAIIFNTMSTRNAGFATVQMSSLTQPTLLIYIIMMFIGSSPSSTAGGIRTTTIAIIFLSIWRQMRGRKRVRAFNRSISKETTSRAFVVFATAIVLVNIGTLIGMTAAAVHGGSLRDVPLIYVMFEVASAFGTTGLSTGITGILTIWAQLALILIMFIGQLGVSSSLLVWSSRMPKSSSYEYIEEDVTIG